MKIESLDRANTQKLVEGLNADLKALGEKYGVALRINGGKLVTDTAAKLNLEVTIEGTGSVRTQRLGENVDMYIKAYLPGYDADKGFKHPEMGKMTIVGWNSKAPKFPVIGATADGRRFKFPIATVKNMIAK